jgi:probable F420-dependent oxidoreductase
VTERFSFGVTFQPDPPVTRTVEWAKIAEETGHDYVWLWDSHVLWQDVYPLFALIAAETHRIRIGPCVTNPATRHPTVTASAVATLNEISGGRMDVGIGRGDSAQRVIGHRPVGLEHLRETCILIRELAAGRTAQVDGVPVRLNWSTGHEVPIWVAGYGPKALRVAGQVADGVILQLADPDLVRWFLGHVRAGAEDAGRRFEDIQVQVAAPAYVSADLEHARDQVRWFPALVSNHVVDLVRRYEPDRLPAALTDYIKARDHYDYSEHGRTGGGNEGFVTDEIVDRFCVIGTVDQVLGRIAELREVGVTQFNNYDMGDDVVAQMRIFGSDVIPALRAGPAGTQGALTQ